MIGFSALALFCVLIGPYVLGPYLMSVVTRGFLFAVPALTVGLLWGFTGVLTFSQAAFFGIGAYAAGLMFTHVGFSAGTAVLAVLLGIAAAALLAWFVGWLAFWHGATPIYVAVVTLVVPIVVVQIIYAGGSFTGSSSGLTGFEIIRLSGAQWFWLAGTLLIGLSVAAWIFGRSDFGRLLNAIRDNEDRCRYLGIQTSRIKTRLMVVMAAMAALAGFLYACSGRTAAPEHADFVFGTELVIYAALGGRATVLGPVFGTVGLETINAFVSSLLPFSWRLIVGAIFVVVIIALPRGLLPPIGSAIVRRLSAAVSVLAPQMLQASEKTAPAVVESSTGSEVQARYDAKSDVPALTLSRVQKSYGHLQVLEDISLDIRGGEFVGIVGPNGAGKTTLMRCISDGMERSGGLVALYGSDIGRRSPADIVNLGLGRSFQNTSLFGTLRVVDCLRLARYRHRRPSPSETDWEIDLPEAAMQVLRSTTLDGRLAEPVHSLPHGLKRALELAMVIALEPRVLLLDEPTAGLTKEDRNMIGDTLQQLQRDSGLAIVLIEHDFDFVKQVCSRLVVLHQGKIVLDGTVDEVVNAPIVQEIYSGVEE